MTALLSCLAWLGNAASVPLYYGIDFIFGSIAVMFAVLTLNRLSTLVVVLIGSLYTLSLWGHPYALIIFTIEALWVSYFWHRGYKRIVLIDASYWIIIGVPLALIFYTQLIGVSTNSAIFIALKQSINGIFNALIAYQIFIIIQVVWKQENQVSIKPVMFNTILIITLVTGSIPAIISSHQSKVLYEEQAYEELNTGMVMISNVIAQQHEVNIASAIATVPKSFYSGIAFLKDDKVIHQVGDIHTLEFDDSDKMRLLKNGLAIWLPGMDKAVMKRWEQGRYYLRLEKQISSMIDSIIIENDTSKVVSQVNDAKTTLFIILAVLLVFAFILSELTSNWITKPIESLSESTHDLIKSITKGKEIHLPESYINEYQNLSLTIYALASELSKNYRDLHSEKESLLGRVEKHSASLRRLSMVASRTNNGVVITDVKGKIEWVNEAFEALTGYKFDELKGKTPGKLLQGDKTDKQTIARISDRLSKQSSFSEDIINYDKTGKPYWLHIDCDPIFENEQLIGFIAIESDITERKEVEEALRDRTARLNAVLEAATEISVISTDSNGVITLFNSGAEKMLGYCSDEMVGKQTPALIHLESEVIQRGQELTNMLGEKVVGFSVFVMLPEREGSETREWTYVRKDGSHITVILSVTAVRTSDGNIIGYLGVAQDITERKRLENMKSEFVSTVSHELRTPLTSIKGTLGLLHGGALGEMPEKIKQMVDIAANNTDRLSFLINDLLDMDKIASGKMTFTLEQVRLMDVIDDSVKLNKSYADRHHVAFNIVNRLENLNVLVDKQRIFQVLANLLSNAAKFSHENSVVDILVENKENSVRVSIRDYGIGIDKSFQEHIFSKFSQADSSDTRMKGGTGLGLAITKELIERMHGELAYESEKDKGSVFWFELPISATQ